MGRVGPDHPVVRLDPQNPTKQELEQVFGRPLPVQNDLVQCLLAWVSKFEGLRWLSAFGMASLLRGESSQWVRDELGKRFSVRAVIEADSIFPDVHPATRLCIIHLSTTACPAFLISIGRGDPIQELRDAVTAANQFFSGRKPARGFTSNVERAERWAVSTYDPELNKVEERLARIGPTKRLADVCTIKRGVSSVKRGRKADQGILLITRIAQLNALVREHEDLKTVALTPEMRRFVLRPGDLIVPAIQGGARQCVMVESEEPLVASDHFFIMRVTGPSVTPEYIVEYLNSTVARRLIEDWYSGSAGLMLTVGTLGSLPVPILERPLALDLRQIGVTEAALRRRADELSLQRQALFEAMSTGGFHCAVQALRRQGKLLSRSVLRANEFEFQVANFYPFPIAYGYRLLASITNPTDLYKEQLRIGENILAFLASVAMSLVQPSDRVSVGLDVRKVWDGGASPGDWRDIVGKCCRVLSTYKDHPLASSIVELRITKQVQGFGAAVNGLIEAKNDFKHDRGPRTEEEFAVATKGTQDTLLTCIKALGFFTEHPIRQVVDDDITRTGEVRLRCLVLVGDHPGLPQEEATHQNPLPKRDLHIAAGGVGWVPLFPLMLAKNCPNCKTRERYFLDKWDRSKGIGFRARPRGEGRRGCQVHGHLAA